MEDNSKDAIIFIPGFDDSEKQSVDTVSLLFMSAFDLQSKSPSTEYRLKSGQDIDYAAYEDTKLKTRCRTVLRTEKTNTTDQPIVDIYEFRYSEALVEKHAKQNELTNAWNLCLVMLLSAPSFWYAFSRQNTQKTTKEKLQFLVALGVLSLLIVYLVTLTFAVFQTVAQVVATQPSVYVATATPDISLGTLALSQIQATVRPEQSTPTPANIQNLSQTEEKTASNRTLSIAQLFVIIVAVLEVYWPSLRQMYSKAAIRYLSLVEYLSAGTRAPALTGHLAKLIDYVAQQEYRRIHLVSYSLGTIIALDVLYPFQDIEHDAAVSKVDTLITIGSPVDIISVFWPHYFKERHSLPGVPKNWINFYSPLDVMGSKFDQPVADWLVGNKEAQQRVAQPTNKVYQVGQRHRETSFWDTLALVGLQAHAFYWDLFEFEHTVFDEVVSALYKDDMVLS